LKLLTPMCVFVYTAIRSLTGICLCLCPYFCIWFSSFVTVSVFALILGYLYLWPCAHICHCLYPYFWLYFHICLCFCLHFYSHICLYLYFYSYICLCLARHLAIPRWSSGCSPLSKNEGLTDQPWWIFRFIYGALEVLFIICPGEVCVAAQKYYYYHSRILV